MFDVVTLLLIKHIPDQTIEVPPGWSIYDNSENPDYQLCEVGAFLDCFLNNQGKFHWPFSTEYAGLLSPKFFRKTRMNGERLAALLDANFPANDVLVVNPYPLAVANAYNIWRRGERKHPGLLELADIAGFDRDAMLARHHGVKFTAYCNYIIGNQHFWRRYIEFIEPVSRSLMGAYRSGKIADKYGHHERPLSDIPYFLERCLADFLMSNLNEINFKKINRGKKVYLSQYLVEPYDAILRSISS